MSMRSKSFGERIADVLIEDGLLLPAQLDEAMNLQKQQGGRLLKILTDKQFVSDQDMAFSMGRCLNTSPINLPKVRVPEEILNLIPRDMAKAHKLVPIARLHRRLFVAMADPTNVLAVDDLKRRVQLDIVPMIATERAVSDALSGVHAAHANMSEVLKQVSEEAGDVEVERQKREEIDLDRLATDSEDAPVIKIVNLVLAQAIKEKASDIHIEPFQRTLKLRYRIDGELVAAESPPKALQLAMTSRIKILAGLNIAERRLPQDGAARVRVARTEFDVRVATMPTQYGESAVIRLLPRDRGLLEIGKLGLLADDETLLRRVLMLPHGMIVITGPTGSGKTTTLATMLSILNESTRKILTIEDPVEYEIHGVNQSQVKPSIGLTFSNALRAFVRQDPDVIMVGEIRDAETANIAIHAALTGHLVLTTLHTETAAAAVWRERVSTSYCLRGARSCSRRPRRRSARTPA